MIVALAAAVTVAAFVTAAGDPQVVAVTAFTGAAAAFGFTIYCLRLRIGDGKLIIKDNLNVIGSDFVCPASPLRAAWGDSVAPFAVGTCQSGPLCRYAYGGCDGSAGWFC